MRSWPATKTASSVDLLTHLIRHSRGGMTLLARQRSRGSAAFAKAGCTRNLAITAQPLRGPAAHSHSWSGIGEEAATPGQPVRVTHALPICPPAIHPRESPAAAGPAAIIRQAQKTLTFSLYPLSVRSLRPAIKKQRTLVRKLWTNCLPCGNPRKTENDSGSSHRFCGSTPPRSSLCLK